MAHYSVNAGVVLSAPTMTFINAVADNFFAETQKDLVVTSAYRGPDTQASAMYDKMQGTEWNIYRDHAALAEIRAAYLKGQAGRQTRTQVVARMAAVIENQVGRGSYISSHLHATAVDFRDRDLSGSELGKLKAACKAAGARVIIAEGQPPHLHVQF